jgi:hypothetical protein
MKLKKQKKFETQQKNPRKKLKEDNDKKQLLHAYETTGINLDKRKTSLEKIISFHL